MAQEPEELTRRPLNRLIDQLASPATAPGAGSAGAIALALAAGCLAKALTLTSKHSPDDYSLSAALEVVTRIRENALRGATEDAECFENFIHQPDAAHAARLIAAGERLQADGARLRALLQQMESRIVSELRGDVIAAKALCEAFETIVSENLRENRAAAASADGGVDRHA
jgi:hypothetical protein